MNKILRSLSILIAFLFIAFEVLGQTPVTPSDGSVILNDGWFSCNVGDQPLNFYDSGGKDGNYQNNQKCVFTFVPEDSSKKVRIKLSNINIFDNPYSIQFHNNDEILVYSGIGERKENLISTIVSQKSANFVSTSEDGAITIVFISKHGRVGSGFEGVATQETPKDMEIGDVSVFMDKKNTKDIVSAFQQDVPLIGLNIRAINTLNNKKLSGISFTITGNALVDKATLYSSSDSTFNKKRLLGDVVVEDLSGEKTITLTDKLDIKQGENYVWLAVDVDKKALEDQLLSVKVSKLIFDTQEKSLTDAQTPVQIKIKNKWVTAEGKKDIYVFTPWQYVATNGMYYDAKSQADNIVTFYPGDNDKTIKIDFSGFSMPWDKNGYTPNPKFIVVSGSDPKGSDVLYQLNGDNYKDIPQPLKSKSNDGAITVVWNPNGGRMASGWKATVSQYKSEPMRFVSAEVSQPNAGNIPISPTPKNVSMANIKILTQGDKRNIELNGLKVKLKGVGSISKLYLYSSIEDNATSDISKAVATADVDGSSDVVSINIPRSVSLSEGENNFKISFDVKNNPSDRVLDVSVLSLNIDNKDILLRENNDPQGDITLVNSINMPSSGEVEVVDVNSQGITFYDNGGPDDKSSIQKEVGVLTFKPTTPGKVIKAIVKKFDVGVNEYFEMYYGADIEKAKLIAVNKDVKEGDVFVSSSEDGSISFKYHNRNKYTKQGWEIQIVEYTPQPIAITSVSVESISKETTLKGATSLMLKLQIKVEGDRGRQTIKTLSLGNNSSFANIKKVVIYDTDKSDVFSKGNIFGESDDIKTSDFDISGEKVFSSSGNYYMFVEYFIGDNVNADTEIFAKANKVKLVEGDKEIKVSGDAVAKTVVKKGFSGSYIIGRSSKADYPTIAEAIKAMSDGIDGKVDFALEDGKYEGSLLVNHIKGTSETNTVTLRSLSGDPSSVCIFDDKYKDIGYSENKSFLEQGVITLDSVQYFTLKDVSVKTGNKNFPMVIKMRSTCSDITFDNVTVEAPQSTGYGGTYLIKTYVGIDETSNMPTNNILLKGCKLIGGRMALAFGSTWITKAPEKGIKIINSSFENQGSKVLYMSRVEDLLIKGNNIVAGKDITNSEINILDISSTDNIQIIGNTISLYSQSSRGNSVFYFRDINSSEDRPFVLANNQIIVDAYSGSNSTIFSFGAKKEEYNNNMKILFNTIISKGKDENVTIFNYLSSRGSFSNNIVANNILQMENGALYKVGDDVKGLEFSNNVSFTSGDYAKERGTVLNYEQWKGKSFVKAEVNKKVEFTSDKILMPKSEEALDIATDKYGIDDDILGNKRDKNTVGAYVYLETIPNINIVDGYPKILLQTNNKVSVNLRFDNPGSVKIIYKKKGEPEPQIADFDNATYSVDVKKDIDVVANIDNLEKDTEYVLYILGYNILGNKGENIYKINVRTTTDPTLAATFEDANTDDDGNIISGTFKFTNISVVDAQGNAYADNSKKVAEINKDTQTKISFTNTDNGQNLKGFFYKGKGQSTINILYVGENGEEETKSETLNATNDQWVYFNLRDKGLVKNITIVPTEKMSIDDFDGEPLPFLFSVNDKEANEGESVTFSIDHQLKNGVAPYSYKWTKIGQDDIPITGESINITADRLMQYCVEGTDAWGRKYSSTAWIRVNSPIKIATFEDYNIKEGEKHFIGDVSKVEDVNTGYDTKWYSGSFRFGVTAHMSTWWSGYALSNETEKDFNGLEDQFRVPTGAGVDNSKGFMVAYPMFDNKNSIEVTSSKDGDVIKGVYVCNSSYTINSITKGDQFSSAFVSNDYFKVIFKGIDSKGETKTLDYYLADYRDSDAKEHYYIDSWQWVDLSSLGKIKYLKFDFDSNKKNKYGITVPAYVCLDNLGDTYHTEKTKIHKVVSGKNVLDLKEFVTLKDADGKIRYTIVEAPDENIVKVSVSDDGKMNIDVLQDFSQDLNIVIKIMQKGKAIYQTYPISMVNGEAVDEVNNNKEVKVYPIPANESVNISCGDKSYSVEIFDLNGTLVSKNTHLTGSNTIDTTSIPNGTYFAKIIIEGKTTIKKIIIRH